MRDLVWTVTHYHYQCDNDKSNNNNNNGVMIREVLMKALTILKRGA